MIKAVLGIGNPGFKYEETRHNIGFMILDCFSKKRNLTFQASKYNYFYTNGELNNSPFFLLKPTTYVNLSGLAAKDFCNEYNVSPENLLVICDDTYLNPGVIRIRRSGGDGGHNGLASIIYHLESNKFPRIRFGIGQNPESIDLKDHVLSKFSPDELIDLKPNIELTAELIEKFIIGGAKEILDHFSKVKNTSRNGEGPETESDQTD
ncbi:MAG: aminoacyl-tRNA hydrolase [bacterium]